MPQLGGQVLPADDVEQCGDRHHRDTQHHPGKIERRGAKECHAEREGYIHRQADEEYRDGEREARADPCTDLGRDVSLVLRRPEIEHEEARGLLEEDRLRQPTRARGRVVPEQWAVVATLGLPFGDRLGRDALGAQLHAGHIVGGIDHEEQRERDQVDPDEDRDRVEDAAEDVGEHRRVSPSPPGVHGGDSS